MEPPLPVAANGASERLVAHEVAHQPDSVEAVATAELGALVVRLQDGVQHGDRTAFEWRRALVDGRHAERADFQIVLCRAVTQRRNGVLQRQVVRRERLLHGFDELKLRADFTSGAHHFSFEEAYRLVLVGYGFHRMVFKVTMLA